MNDMKLCPDCGARLLSPSYPKLHTCTKADLHKRVKQLQAENNQRKQTNIDFNNGYESAQRGEPAGKKQDDVLSGWKVFMFDELEAAFAKIKNWTKAYPLQVFPEPDFKKAATVLKAAGINIEAISASNMRHVLEGVKGIVEKAQKKGGVK